MIEQFLKFGDIKIEKKKFHSSKKSVNVNKVYIEKTLVSNELAYGKNRKWMPNILYSTKLAKK